MRGLSSRGKGNMPLSGRPFGKAERMLAARYLKPGRATVSISLNAAFSFLGIMLGVATLIVVMSVMNGFRTEILKTILGVSGHITVQPIDGAFTDYGSVADAVTKVDGVNFAMPFIEGQALASGAGQASGVLVRGLRESNLRDLTLIEAGIKDGSLQDFDASDGVIIGRLLAQKMGAFVGGSITLVTPEGNVTPMGTTPRVKAYPVAAIFDVNMTQYDSNFVFMPFEEAQLFFNQEGIASAIDVFVDDPDTVGDLRRDVENATTRLVYLTDWRQRNLSFFSALEVERNMMFMILTMIVLVAALNIISGLAMLVREKRSDIAILRTMGASNLSILRIFLMTGMTIGVLGTFAGVALGLVIAVNAETIRQFLSSFSNTTLFPADIYMLSRLPSKIDPAEISRVVLMSLGLSLLATLQPALKAARLDPVTALRGG